MRKNKVLVNVFKFLAAIILCFVIAISGKHLALTHASSIFIFVLSWAIIFCIIGYWFIKILLFLFYKDSEKKLISTILRVEKGIDNLDITNSKNFIQLVEKTIKELKHQRFLTGKKGVDLHKLPWYMVSGPSSYGKTQLIQKSGLSFPLLKSPNFDNEIGNNNSNLKCWVTEEAVFLEISKGNSQEQWNSELYSKIWLDTLKVLKKYRQGRILNGVIFAIDVSYFMGDSKERAQKIAGTRQHIKNIYEQLKFKFPLYIMVTKCDLISGFTEYFDNLTPHERDNVLGFSFTNKETGEANWEQALSNEFDTLVHKLAQRLPWLLHRENDSNKKSLIALLPQQFFLLKKRLIDVFAEVLMPQKLYELLDLRGIFFTSANQEVAYSFDILGSITANQLQLFPAQQAQHINLQQGCFIKKVFRDIILPEAKLLDNKSHKLRREGFFYKATSYFAVASIIGAAFISFYTAINTKNITHQATHYLRTIISSHEIYESQSSYKELLKLMSPLNGLSSLYSQANKHSMLTFYPHQKNKIEDSIRQVYIRKLNKTLIPLVASQLENNLITYKENPALLFDSLKAYLYLGNPQALPSEWLANTMQYFWNADKRYSAAEVNNLSEYLQLAIQGLQPSFQDQKLISQAIINLRKFSTSERVYLAIKINANNAAPLDVNHFIGDSYKSVFKQTTTGIIPSLFTMQGYESFYKKALNTSVINALLDEQKLYKFNNANNLGNIKKPQTIKDTINSAYSAEYIHCWSNLLNSYQIAPFEDLNHAIRIIEILKDHQSPINRLLFLTKTNTNNVNLGSNNVIQAFAALNNFTSLNGSNGVNIISLSNTLNNLYNFLVQIEQSPNQEKAAYMVISQSFRTNKPTPIEQLRFKANVLPEPLKSWYTQVADNCLSQVLNLAHDYVAQEWKNQVVDKYENITSFFPLNTSSDLDISPIDFVSFFGPNGTLKKFYYEYLTPFINKDQDQWVWRDFNGAALSKDALALDEIHNLLKATEYLFPGNSSKIAVKFQLRTLLLSGKAASLQLQIGNQKLLYRFGPLETFSFSWPDSDDSKVSIIYTDFRNKELTKQFDGPWSLLRFLNEGMLKPSAEPFHYDFTTSFFNYRASFEIIIPNNHIILTLMNLDKLELPETL